MYELFLIYTKTIQFAFKATNQYTIQGDLFSKAILENTAVPTPLEDAVNNMKIIEAILQSGQEKIWKIV